MKKIIKLLLILTFAMVTYLLIGTAASAAPAYESDYMARQPSGEAFMVSTHGDEWLNYTATTSGDVVVFGEDGYWYYAVPDADGYTQGTAKYMIDARPANALTVDDMAALRVDQNALAPSMPDVFGPMFAPGLQTMGLPSPSGTQQILVLLVSFSDTAIQNTDAFWNSAFFGATDSVKSYYTEISGGQFTFVPAAETGGDANNDGIIPVTLGYNHPNPGTITNDDNRNIVKNALMAADTLIDYGAFDTDHNGYIDTSELHIVTLTAGYERSYSDNSPSVWAHRWSLSGSVPAPQLDGVYLCNPLEGGGYTQQGEIHENHTATIGTICHELGHDLGLMDLYDTVSGNGDSEGAGFYSLMGSGNWMRARGAMGPTSWPGDTPSHLDAWSKIELGWAAPTVVGSSGNYDLYADAVGGITYNILKIPTSDPNQYFLIENREYNGFDDGLYNYTNDGGIAIWHIDESVITATFGSNTINGDATHKGVDLEEANYAAYGGSQLDDNNSASVVYNNLYSSAVNTAFGPATAPNTSLYNMTATHITVDVTGAAANTMTVGVTLLSNSAALDFTAGTGSKLAGVVLTDDSAAESGANEANAKPLSVTIANADAAAAVFVPVTENATVTAYADNGTGGGGYAAVAGSYNFSGANTTLWIKVVSKDTSATLYYKLTVTVTSNDATITSGSLATVALAGDFNGAGTIAGSSALTVTIPDGSKTNAALALIPGNANATIKYILGAQPANDAAYTGTYTAGATNITVANNDVIWLLVTAEDGATKLYYKITVTVTAPASNDATITSGSLATVALAGDFNGAGTIAGSSALTVTIPDGSKTNAALALIPGNANATIKYILGAQPANDAAYTGTYTAGATNITVANNDVIWLLVTAEDGATKLYYKITVTVTAPASNDATITSGSLATVALAGDFNGAGTIAGSSALTVTIPDGSKTNAALALTPGNANATIKYVLGAQPANDAAYTGTYTAGATNITVANNDVIWLLVTAQDGATKLYYKITVTVTAPASNDATITSGSLATVALAGDFNGAGTIAGSSALTVTIPDGSKTNAALALTPGNANATIKYVLSAGQPANDAAYTGTYTAGATNITVANNDVIWLLVTAQDGATKLYYKITVTVTAPAGNDATITSGSLATVALAGDFNGAGTIAGSSALTVTIPDASKTNAALALTPGNANATIKYVLGAQPANDAAYTGTYTAGATNITVANNDVIWLLVTAEDGATKLYYKITVTVTAPASNDATITSGSLATVALAGDFNGAGTIAGSSALTVTIPDGSKTNAALALIPGNANATIKYILGAQPANDAAYTGTYTAGATNITVANNNVIWLLVTAEDGATKLYYKITVTVTAPASNDATITSGSLATVALAGDFNGAGTIAGSSALTVTIPDASKTNAALALTPGNANATIKYVLSAGQPANDAAYTGTYTAGATNITVANNDVIWLLVTAEDGATKLYYKITVTVTPPPASNDATITSGSLATVALAGDFNGAGTIAGSSALTVTIPDGSKTNAALALTPGNANATINYVLNAGQPANDAAYTGTYTAGATNITVANGDVIWLLVTAQDGATKLYYKITVTVTPPSSDASITGGTLAGYTMTGSFAGGANIAGSSALLVTIPDFASINAALALTPGNANATINYVLSAGQPANDAAYAGLYAAGATNITVSNGDVIWLLVTAQDGTKLYYNLTVTVTVTPPPPPPPPPSGGDDTPPPEDPNTSEFTMGKITQASVDITGSSSAGNTTAALSDTTMTKLMSIVSEAESAGKDATILINVTDTGSSNSVNLTITHSQFGEMAAGSDADLTFSTGIGSVTFGGETVDLIYAASGGKDINVSISKVDASTLSAGMQSQIGNRPVYDFTVTAGGSPISEFGGNSVAVSVPYTLQPGEDPNNIVIYYIDDSGNLTMVQNCVYDQQAGTVSFLTDHFSRYAVAYVDTDFDDVSGWYADSVNFLAARGIINGIGNGLFGPDESITRAQFVTILANLSGDDLSVYRTSSFNDVKTTDWYFRAVQWACDNNIVMGSDGLFNPNDTITRQDMAVILQRYAELIGYQLPAEFDAKSFTDGSDIAGYAREAVTTMQRAGVISGYTDNRFAPTDSASRGEAAKMIAVFIQGMFA